MLAERLLSSLEDDEPSEEIEKSWNKEAMKRYKAYKAGKVKTLGHAEVMREAYRSVAVKPK